MGVGVLPVFNPRVAEATFDSDGKILLRESESLDAIARKIGITPFTAFGDNRTVPEDFEGAPDELEEMLGEWNEWFSIDDGLKTIEGVGNAIKSDPQAFELLEDADWVCSELEDLARCLRIASSVNARFRLEIA